MMCRNNWLFLGVILVFASQGYAQQLNVEKNQNRVSKIDSFYMPQLNRYRSIWVYLPPDYYSSTKKYPVLYMQDGQNLFEDSASFVGEWHVDETLDSLQSLGDYGCIAIGIENGGNLRTEEYMAHQNEKYGGGKGNEYVDFLVQTLKPWVDSTYRTLADAENTGIGGSSLGALISYYAALNRPDVFQRAMIFSPAFWIDDSIHYSWNNGFPEVETLKFYFLAGQLEGEKGEVVEEIEFVENIYQMYGLNSDNYVIKISPDGEHREWFWTREFGPAYHWLFKDELKE
jgi:alpha-glucosidase